LSWKDWILPPAWQQKASAVTRLVVSMYSGNPVWTPREYDKLAKEGFEQNIWVYRCVMVTAQAVAAVDWLAYGDQRKKKELETHPMLELLYKPNEFMSKQEFFEALAAYVLLSGNSYIEANGPNVGPPKELFPLRPDRMQVIPDAENFIGGYKYRVNDSSKVFETQQVGHLKFFHALNDYYGLSPIEVAARGIDNDNAASAWNNALLNNGSRPTGALVTENALTEFQYDNLKRELDNNVKGAQNSGKPMLLEGGLKWQEMGLSPRDMDFIESKKMSRLEICAAFGVPPELVGVGEQKTYANYQEARQAFYQDTVLPLLDKIRDKLNSWLAPKFGNVFLDYDKDSIEALQENTDEKAKRIREDLKAGLIMLDEARQATGYEEVAGGKGKVFYIPNTARVVDEKGTVLYQPEPAALPAPGEPEDDELKKSFFFNIKSIGILDSDESKTMFWKAMDRRREAYYKKVSQQVRKQFEAEKNAVLKAYEANGDIEEVEKALSKHKDSWIKLLTEIDVMVIEDFGNAMFTQLKSEAAVLEVKGPLAGFNVFAKLITEWIVKSVAQKVVMINNTTMEKIKAIVFDGQTNGKSIKEITKNIDSLYLDQIIPNRSEVIARTEVISSSNAGNRFAAIQTDLPLTKEWISTRDERTRDTHIDIDGQIRDRDKYYDLSSGVQLMFPGDPNGRKEGLTGKDLDKATAKEVIQCRCTEGFSVKK
jgi:HK97 family phage portal protein